MLTSLYHHENVLKFSFLLPHTNTKLFSTHCTSQKYHVELLPKSYHLIAHPLFARNIQYHWCDTVQKQSGQGSTGERRAVETVDKRHLSAMGACIPGWHCSSPKKTIFISGRVPHFISTT